FACCWSLPCHDWRFDPLTWTCLCGLMRLRQLAFDPEWRTCYRFGRGNRSSAMAKGVDRRTFSKAVATATAAAMSIAPGRVLGANDQVRIGFIGVGNRGCQLLRGFLAQPDAKVVGLCDIYEPYLNAAYDRIDPRFSGLGKRIPQMPKLT